MKELKHACILLLLLSPYILLAQEKISVKGKIDKSMDNKMIRMYLILPSYSSLLPAPEFETVIENGEFSFEAPVKGFEIYGFQIEHNGKKYNQVIESMPRDIKIHFLDTLLKTYKLGDKGFQRSYLTALEKMKSAKKDTLLLIRYMEKYIKEPFASMFLFSFINEFNEQQIVRLNNQVPEKYRKNSWSTDLKILETKFSIGKRAKNFTQQNPNGINVSLSDYKGKYVLLDFWASWCIPCRSENPNLIRAYTDFNKKGFEILSVSLDTESYNWKEAIKKDRLTWQQVSDLKGWDNSVSKELYNIHLIPQNYLIDPNGVIIAVNLFGDQLYDLLKQKL